MNGWSIFVVTCNILDSGNVFDQLSSECAGNAGSWNEILVSFQVIAAIVPSNRLQLIPLMTFPHWFIICNQPTTDQVGSCDDTFDLYLGGAQFKPWPGHWLSWLRIVLVFPQSLQESVGIVSLIRQWLLYSCPVQLIEYFCSLNAV